MQLWNITSLQNRKHLSRNKSMGRFSPSHQTQSKLIILIEYGDIQSKCVHLTPNLFLKSVFKVWFCRHDNQQGPLLPFTQVKLTSNVIVPFYTPSVHTHVVFELMFLTYDQLPRSIIVGTRGELNSQLWNVAGKPWKTNLKIDVFSLMWCALVRRGFYFSLKWCERWKLFSGWV